MSDTTYSVKRYDGLFISSRGKLRAGLRNAQEFETEDEAQQAIIDQCATENVPELFYTVVHYD